MQKLPVLALSIILGLSLENAFAKSHPLMRRVMEKPMLLERETDAADDTDAPTEAPTDAPTGAATDAPTGAATDAPTDAPGSDAPTDAPGSDAPTDAPGSDATTDAPATDAPTDAPATDDPNATDAPTEAPTPAVTAAPTPAPTPAAPTPAPTEAPTPAPTPYKQIWHSTYAQEILKDNPIGFWSMEHEHILQHGTLELEQLGEPCEAEPEGNHSETGPLRAARVPRSKYHAMGEACGGDPEWGDPCGVDALLCSTHSTWSSNLVHGLTSEGDAKATLFHGEEYLRVPEHHKINTNMTGYPHRTVELWFKAMSADDVWRVIYSEGSAQDSGLAMYVRQGNLSGIETHLKMFAWDRGAHDAEFGTLDHSQSIMPWPISCQIEENQTYYAVMEFNGVARTLTGYIRKQNHSTGTNITVCGRNDQYPVGAKIGVHGNGKGNAVIGGVGSCPLQQLICPSSRGDGTDLGQIARRELWDGTAAAHNFHGVIDEVAIYNHVLSMDAMRRHLCAGGDVAMCSGNYTPSTSEHNGNETIFMDETNDTVPPAPFDPQFPNASDYVSQHIGTDGDAPAS